jgi:hypothetical protein
MFLPKNWPLILGAQNCREQLQATMTTVTYGQPHPILRSSTYRYGIGSTRPASLKPRNRSLHESHVPQASPSD